MRKLTQIQKDLIIGTILGDGNMQTYSKGKTWRYIALQSGGQKEYIFHKYEVLGSLCGTKPKESSYLDKRTNKVYTRYSFNTLTNPSLRFFGNLFYKLDNTTGKWIKRIPVNIGLFLTPRTLAYMYMDDGSLKWKDDSVCTRLCTDNFNLIEVKRIQKVLLNKYNINTTLSKVNLKNKKGYRIEISCIKDGLTFHDLIKPYMHETMVYKIPSN